MNDKKRKKLTENLDRQYDEFKKFMLEQSKKYIMDNAWNILLVNSAYTSLEAIIDTEDNAELLPLVAQKNCLQKVVKEAMEATTEQDLLGVTDEAIDSVAYEEGLYV